MGLVRVDRRGQVVLAAAAVVAVTLVPMTLAYLQLGAHPDVEAGGDYDDPAADVHRALEGAVHEAAHETRTHPWPARERTVAAADDRLASATASLAGAGVEEGVAYRIARNGTAARAWAERNCPGGDMREFGDCEVSRGIVVQERAGETHVVAVAFDVTVTTERGTTSFTAVYRPVSEG